MSDSFVGTGRETSGIPVQWGPLQDHTACNEAIAAARAAGAREALLAVAADFDARSMAGVGWDNRASTAWANAAEVARERADSGPAPANGMRPVSPDTPERSVHPGAALPPCPTPCDDDCDAECHEIHGTHERRAHQPWACEDIRRAIAAAVVAERARIAADLERRAEESPATPYGHAAAVSYREVVQFIREQA